MHPGVLILATIISVGVGFVVAQTDTSLRHPVIDRTHSVEHFVTVTPQAKVVFAKSCADCHSNETKWNWYSYVPYIGSRLQTDVRKGRGRLNLSDWPALVHEGPEEVVGRVIAVCDEVELENMPPRRYTYLHPSAKLTAQDRKTLCSWSQTAQQELQQSAASTQANTPKP